MKNIFEVSPESHYKFELKKLGNIKKGRDEIFKQASYLAECEFAKNALPLDVDESTFISTLVQTLETLKVGILRLENLVL